MARYVVRQSRTSGLYYIYDLERNRLLRVIGSTAYAGRKALELAARLNARPLTNVT